jgi:alkylhydroperoxidase family enzyme
MLDYALKVAGDSSAVMQADFDALTAHGFDMEDVWDIGNIAALFALSNRMANATGLMPNTEFYKMGR